MNDEGSRAGGGKPSKADLENIDSPVGAFHEGGEADIEVGDANS